MLRDFSELRLKVRILGIADAEKMKMATIMIFCIFFSKDLNDDIKYKKIKIRAKEADKIDN